MRLTSFPSIRKISVLSLALTCALGAVASDGYERLTYLQGTGNGEAGGTWINTGYVPTCTDRIEFRMQFLDIQTAQGFYCSRMSGTDRVIACILSASKREYLRFDRNNDNSTGYSTLRLDTSSIYDVVADYNTLSCTMDGEPVATMASGDFTPVGPLTLFALYSGASPVSMSNYAQSRLYSCRIYDKNGTLVREFLPAHDKSAAGDSIARYGLFETVTGSFLPNCGKLSFGVKTTDLDRTFDVADIVTQNVSRAPCRPSVTVVDPKTGATLTEGADYEVDYANNLAVGTAYVCVSGKAGTAYEGVSVYKHFTIGESALPEGYTKLSYIETTRKTGEAPAGQWVDTGYVPTCEDRFEIKVRTFDEKLAEGLFCSRLSATEATMAAVYPNASPKKLRFDCNTDKASASPRSNVPPRKIRSSSPITRRASARLTGSRPPRWRAALSSRRDRLRSWAFTWAFRRMMTERSWAIPPMLVSITSRSLTGTASWFASTSRRGTMPPRRAAGRSTAFTRRLRPRSIRTGALLRLRPVTSSRPVRPGRGLPLRTFRRRC